MNEIYITRVMNIKLYENPYQRRRRCL